MTLENTHTQDEPPPISHPGDNSNLTPGPSDSGCSDFVISSTTGQLAETVHRHRYTLAGQTSITARHIQGDYTAEIGHYGLTPATGLRPPTVPGSDLTPRLPAEVGPAPRTNPTSAYPRRLPLTTERRPRRPKKRDHLSTTLTPVEEEEEVVRDPDPVCSLRQKSCARVSRRLAI